MSLTEEELVYDGLCMRVCEACMERGETCECGYHETELPFGSYICPKRQTCPQAQGCMHAVYHEPDDGCDWKEQVCIDIGEVNCVDGEVCPKCGKRKMRGGYCYECQEWV